VKNVKISFQGHKGSFHQYLIFLKLKSLCQSNRTTKPTLPTLSLSVELFYGEVGMMSHPKTRMIGLNQDYYGVSLPK
jgi:hypothetical protein